VWTYLQNWLVQDGEIPELIPGAELSDVAVRASCWSIRESTETVSVKELQGPDPDEEATAHYGVTGVVAWGREPNALVLDAGAFQLMAEPNTFRQARGNLHHYDGVEPYSPDFFVPAAGTRVTVVCKLQVMADYESDPDAFGFPDVRKDWIVKQLRLEHRALLPVTKGGSRIAEITRVDDITQMRRWADDSEHGHVTYIVHIQPRT
jgi:hypothetical protein